MKSPEKYMARWLHPFVFAAWTAFTIYLLASGRYLEFLRPEFGMLLAVAHFIAMGFMIAAMARPKETDFSGVLRALVLLTPILFAVAMPEAMLGNQTFKKRFVGTENVVAGRQDRSLLSARGTENDPDSPPGETQGGLPDTETPLEPTILEIYLEPDFYGGRRVVVTGMILRDKILEEHFGGMDTAVFRFLINCCAADALPLAIALDSDLAAPFPNDQWVRADGIFALRQIDGKPVPVIENATITAVEKPAVPYLF